MEPNDVLGVLLEIFNFLRVTVVALVMMVVYAVRTCLPASVLGKKSVRGEIVLVTGAGSGIGRLLTLRFAQLGARLVVWDVNEKANKETAQLVRDRGGEATAYTVDLSKREDVYRVAEKVKKEVGDVDILVNNAGIVTGKKFLDCPDELMVKTMEVNAIAHFWTAKAFLPSMMDRNHGHLVTIASGAGIVGMSGLADYCASKFAAVGFHESMGIEMDTLGKTGVKTTLVCPYYINTGMFDGVKTKYEGMLPILQPEYAADKILDAVLTNQDILYMPRILYLLFYMKGFLPIKVGYYLGHFFGVTHSMDSFKGRQGVKGRH